MSVKEVGNSSGEIWELASGKEKDSQEGLTETFSQLVQGKREEYFEKIRKNGTAEPSYQIGASSYTEKQWDKLLKSFDAAEEALRRAAGLKTKKKPVKPLKDYQKEEILEDKEDNLLTQTTSCKCGQEDCKQEDKVSLLFAQAIFCNCKEADTEEEAHYVVFYTPEGICCRKEKGGRVLLEWYIDFDEDFQYEKVAEFANHLDSKENLDFVSRKDFWQDFLKAE